LNEVSQLGEAVVTKLKAKMSELRLEV
jgi:hypothetical protein